MTCQDMPLSPPINVYWSLYKILMCAWLHLSAPVSHLPRASLIAAAHILWLTHYGTDTYVVCEPSPLSRSLQCVFRFLHLLLSAARLSGDILILLRK